MYPWLWSKWKRSTQTLWFWISNPSRTAQGGRAPVLPCAALTRAVTAAAVALVRPLKISGLHLTVNLGCGIVDTVGDGPSSWPSYPRTCRQRQLWMHRDGSNWRGAPEVLFPRFSCSSGPLHRGVTCFLGFRKIHPCPCKKNTQFSQCSQCMKNNPICKIMLISCWL